MSDSVRRRLADETGSVSFVIIAIVIISVLMTGLMVDGGSIRNARRSSADVAQQAARAGAQEIDRNHFLAYEEVVLDPTKARQAALAVLGVEGVTGTIAVNDKSVTITVTQPVNLILLGGGRTVSATRSADAYEGT